MKLSLEVLEHQNEAFDAFISAISGLYSRPVKSGIDLYKNPEIYGFENTDLKPLEGTETYVIDIKMETGTGKTLVYNKLMYGLRRQLGISKFMVLVPTKAIKAGAEYFMDAPYVTDFFDRNDQFHGYTLRKYVMEALKGASKNKRISLPSSLNDFFNGSKISPDELDVLLANNQLLGIGKTKLLDRMDYSGSNVLGEIRPYDALKLISPVVIIDEPHRMSREDKTFKAMLENIQPQLIIRIGATFPVLKKGKKKGEIDYQNLVYDLDGVEAFNRGLVKSVDVFYPTESVAQDTKFKLIALENSNKTAVFENSKTKKTYEINRLDSLSEISSELTGIKFIGKVPGQKAAEFSNNMILKVGKTLSTSLFSKSYQMILMRQAIRLHFSRERANFLRNDGKIKTLALFFIDSVNSFRTHDDEPGWLRIAFEDMLKEEIQIELNNITNVGGTSEYKEFLKATLSNVSASIAGYFAQDLDSTDEQIGQEVEKILGEKEGLLSFKNSVGWNTTRFIFSKWTLREGWDNPNVFTIAKLRSSGSEISKLQEVGRGLRLPVNEFGQRIVNEENNPGLEGTPFRLNYLVDYSEQDFAKRLSGEINAGRINSAAKNIKEILKQLDSLDESAKNAFFVELVTKGFINFDGKIIPNKRNELFDSYSELLGGLKDGKVREINKVPEVKRVHIRQNNFEKIASIWSEITSQRMLQYSAIDQTVIIDLMNQAILDAIKSIPNGYRFIKSQMSSSEENIQFDTNSDAGLAIKDMPIKYGLFLRLLHEKTAIELKIIHQIMMEVIENNIISMDLLTESLIEAIATQYKSLFWKKQPFIINYRKLDNRARATGLTNRDGTPVKELIQGLVGTKSVDDVIMPDNYLYDEFVYDSDIEKELLNTAKDSVHSPISYGKLPRRSLKIPTFFGETTSPDFIFINETSDGDVKLSVIIESKNVQSDAGLRISENVKLSLAEKLFDTLKTEGIPVEYKRFEKGDTLLEKLASFYE